MRGKMKCGVAAIVLLVAAVSGKGKGDRDETLQGTWECMVCFSDGKMETETIGQREKIGTTRIGDEVAFRWANETSSEDFSLEYSLNSARSPREIDLVLVTRLRNSKGERSEKREPFARGIYLLKNDVLVCCLSDPDGDRPLQRPQRFSTESGNWFLVSKKCKGKKTKRAGTNKDAM